MKNIRFLMITVGTMAALGGPVLDVIAADTSAVKMSFSANENYLRRFRKERETLAQATDPESVKKREALDKKIQGLEAENARLSNVLQKNKGAQATTAPAVKSTSAPVASAPTPVAEPVVSAPKASQETWTPKISTSQTPAVSEWEKMNREQKEKYVLNLVNELKKQGMAVERHPLFYTALMDYVFVSDAALAAKSLKEAIVLTIQKNETSWRALRQA